MNRPAQPAVLLVCLSILAVVLPIPLKAEPQSAGQRAGEISRIIPAVTLTRGSSAMDAAEKAVVDWQDIIHTQSNGRVRISLDDGSALNVGSESVMQIVKHDARNQQTALDLVSGKMRVEAKKLNIPGAKFEVRTPSGIAGVVGTDFYVAQEDNQMTVAVFEGRVKFCNLAGVCVEVGEGQMSTVRNNDPSGPSQPATAAQSLLAEAGIATSLEAGLARQQVGIVTDAVSAHIGNSSASGGETVFSGDTLLTDAGGSLDVRIGMMGLKLESNSQAYLYRTPYGAVVELGRGSLVYNKPAGPPNVVIVASDIRVTPFVSDADLGRVRVDDPCKIAVTSQRGQASVQVGSETKTIEQGKSYQVAAEYAVSANEPHSPESDDYHTSHYHRPCMMAQGANGRPPLYPSHSRFIYFAIGTGIAVTLIPAVISFESPNKP